MSNELICKMAGCGGILNKPVSLQTGCFSSSPCLGCEKCGRVHSSGGSLMFNRPGAAVYLREDGLELVMEPKNFTIGTAYISRGYLFVFIESEDLEDSEMVDLDPDTMLTFDGVNEDGMFRFHSDSGIRYLLHRGDVNFIEEV